jgi:hypothetical protein
MSSQHRLTFSSIIATVDTPQLRLAVTAIEWCTADFQLVLCNVGDDVTAALGRERLPKT